jgi:choline dehydrogenase
MNLSQFVNSATAYPNITDLLGPDFVATFQGELSSTLATAAANGLIPSSDARVAAGYAAIYNATLALTNTPVGVVELLLSLTGTAVGGARSVAIQAALQHPYSQGRLYINSSSAFDKPIIDPAYFSHPSDTVLLREGLKLCRKLGSTAPLSGALAGEVSPGSAVSSDADWDSWLANNTGTEYHPACSCAMLPESLGGVVGPDLRVHGTANVRVVDASVFPIQFAAHVSAVPSCFTMVMEADACLQLQAPTYGLAEQAANIIRAFYSGAPIASSTSTSAGTGAGTATQNGGTSPTASTKSSAARVQYAHASPLLGAAAVLAIGILALT